MQLNDADVEEFRRIYQEAYGEEMSLKEARMWAVRLVRLYRILLQPTPSELREQSRMTGKGDQSLSSISSFVSQNVTARK
jgi:hypothetical protein